MTARMTRKEAWGYFEHPLTNAQTAEKGELICIDTSTGLLVIAATSTTLRPIGYLDNGDGVTTGDATTKVRVRLFDEIWVHWFDNDGGTAVVAADVGGLCYLLDPVTVTGASAGASAAGRVWAVDSALGVAVEMIGFDAAVS